jgi:hypothetical protein
MDKWDYAGLVGIAIVIAAFLLTQAYAESFGIKLDNTCLTMIRNNVTSNCPTYEDIITLFPDTSNQDVSGKLGYHNGIYQRSSTKLINSFEYYRHGNNNIIFIDPPSDTQSRIKIIEIKANLDQYILRGKSPTFNSTQYSLTMGINRHVFDCRLAYVDASTWITTVGDTLYHMNEKCTPESTNLQTRTTTQLYKIEHDISTSYKYKLWQWQKEMINRCGTKVCIYEEGQPSPP